MFAAHRDCSIAIMSAASFDNAVAQLEKDNCILRSRLDSALDELKVAHQENSDLTHELSDALSELSAVRAALVEKSETLAVEQLLTKRVCTKIEVVEEDLWATQLLMRFQTMAKISAELSAEKVEQENARLREDLRHSHRLVIESACHALQHTDEEKEEDTASAPTCSICLDRESTNAFVGCGHLAVCGDCSRLPTLKGCPMCRSTDARSWRIFMA